MRFVSLHSPLRASKARQRWSILECIHLHLLVFFTQNLHSFRRTRKASAQITREKFNMNPGEKQAEIYTYEAPWLIYACNWSVRLRFFFFILCAKRFTCRSFSLSFSLCSCEMEFQSGAALYSLRNGIQIISTMLCTLCCTRRSIRANFN